MELKKILSDIYQCFVRLTQTLASSSASLVYLYNMMDMDTLAQDKKYDPSGTATTFRFIFPLHHTTTTCMYNLLYVVQ